MKLQKNQLRLVLTTLLALCFFTACSSIEAAGNNPHSINTSDFDFEEIVKKLNSEGLELEVHGAVPNFNIYVGTLRDQKSFFNFLHMSLISRNPEIKKQLSMLQRHDRIRVWGELLKNESQQKHIKLSQLKLIKKYEPKPNMPKHDYDVTVPEYLSKIDHEKFLVHAVLAEGNILVVEHKQVVLPVYVTNNKYTKNLDRGDKILLYYTIQESPGRPMHLALNTEIEKPVEVIESIRNQHGHQGSIEGELVLFLESPQVKFDVWAVLQYDPDGLHRNYTVINFENPELFKAIRNKFAEAWKKDPQNFSSGRNKLVHNKIRVKVSGTINFTDTNQANPQVLVDSLENIQIFE